jgi:large subunit ribosomal protein L2
LLVRRYADKVYSIVKLKSGEHRKVPQNALAQLGVCSNARHFLRDYGKAGVVRNLGIRPRVRAFAKNPVDHPMGGRTKGGFPPKTPKGKLTLCTPTRSNKRTERFILISQRKVKLKERNKSLKNIK